MKNVLTQRNEPINKLMVKLIQVIVRDKMTVKCNAMIIKKKKSKDYLSANQQSKLAKKKTSKNKTVKCRFEIKLKLK